MPIGNPRKKERKKKVSNGVHMSKCLSESFKTLDEKVTWNVHYENKASEHLWLVYLDMNLHFKDPMCWKEWMVYLDSSLSQLTKGGQQWQVQKSPPLTSFLLIKQVKVTDWMGKIILS